MYNIRELPMPKSGVAVAIGGGLMAGASVYSGMQSAKAAKSAAKAQKQATAAMEKRLDTAATDIEVASNDYVGALQNLDSSFDLYDFSAAFASLQESIIAPLERDYQEYVVPSMNATYSGFGSGLQSGAYKETAAKSRLQLAETKATLRAGERESGMARNVDEYNRKAGLLQSVLSARIMGPQVRAEQTGQIYSARTDSIAATLAARQQAANIIPNAINAGMSGALMGASLKGSFGGGSGRSTVGPTVKPEVVTPNTSWM